jgi:H+/Cl- antiporter ClcA
MTESQKNDYSNDSDEESYERCRMDDESRSSHSSNSVDSLSLPSNLSKSPYHSEIGPSKERMYGYEHTIYGYYDQFEEEAQEMIAQIKAARQAMKKDEVAVSAGDDNRKRSSHEEQTKPSRRRCTQCFDAIPRRELSVLYLVILGILTALIITAVNASFTYILNIREFWLMIVSPLAAQFFLWLGHTLLFLGLAVFFTKVISIHAIGSGTPEMKAILSGVHLKQYLKLKTLIAKCLGLVCAIGSGCVIGEEGPYVHIASIIANNLFRLRLFRKFAISPPFIQSMLAAGVACGLSTSFGGSIIGGVLFSIEATSTYYPIRNYWYAFIAALVGTVTFKVLSNLIFGNALLAPFIEASFESSDNDLAIYEVLFFAVLGAIMGIFGACFVWLNQNFYKFRHKYETEWKFLRPYSYTVITAIVTAVFTFPGFFGNFMSLSPFNAIEDLLRPESLSYGYLPNTLNADWSSISIWYSLPLFGFSQYGMLLLTLGVPVPAGLFVPFLAIGAAFGRIVGEAVNFWIPNGVVSAGVYALVGAAGMVAGVTQTISVAVVVFEMTASIKHALPVFLGVIVSYLTSSRLSISVYDSLAQLKGLPYLPDLQDRNYIQVAKDLMDCNVPFLTMRTTLKEIKKLLEELSKLEDYRNQLIPIVHTAEHKILIGTTTFDALQHLYVTTILELRKEREEHRKGVRGFTLTEQRRRHKIINIEHRLKSIVYGAPIQFLPKTPLAQIHILFITFRLVTAFVTKNGKLEGVIRRSALLRAVQQVTPFQPKKRNTQQQNPSSPHK